MGAMWVYLNESGSGTAINTGQFSGPPLLVYSFAGAGRYFLQNINPDTPFKASAPCHADAFTTSDGYVRPDASGALWITLVHVGVWPDCP